MKLYFKNYYLFVLNLIEQKKISLYVLRNEYKCIYKLGNVIQENNIIAE